MSGWKNNLCDFSQHICDSSEKLFGRSSRWDFGRVECSFCAMNKINDFMFGHVVNLLVHIRPDDAQHRSARRRSRFNARKSCASGLYYGAERRCCNLR
ncbi:hypothetical protein ACOMHN_060066 [Nucella lapillus]